METRTIYVIVAVIVAILLISIIVWKVSKPKERYSNTTKRSKAANSSSPKSSSVPTLDMKSIDAKKFTDFLDQNPVFKKIYKPLDSIQPQREPKLDNTNPEQWDPKKYACPRGYCPGLGQLFDLTVVNGLNDPLALQGGKMIFKNIDLDTCSQVSNNGPTSRIMRNAKSTSEIMDKVASEMKVSGDIPTQAASIKASVQANTGSDIHNTSDIQTAYMDIYMSAGTVSYNKSGYCMGIDNLEEDFISDFKSLPYIIGNPENTADWSKYTSFLHSWGTHVLTKITYGSRLQQWESMESTSTDTLDTLQAKSCAEVEGIIPGKDSYSVSACASYDESKRRQASSAKTDSQRIVIGGSEEDRRMFTAGGPITLETINTFLSHNNLADQGIIFEFTPIWEILSTIYSSSCAEEAFAGKSTTDKLSPGCQDFQRVLNIHAAFGFIAVDCEYKVATNGAEYQKFKLDSVSQSGLSTYQCWAAKTGCVHNSDCHHDGYATCYCHGPSCFEQGSAVGDPSSGIYKRKPKGDASGSYDSGVNQSCSGYLYFSDCTCDDKWSGGLPAGPIWRMI